jgi:hypothetical protein
MLLLPIRTTRPTISVLSRTRSWSLSFLSFFCWFLFSIPHYPLQDIQLRFNDARESLNNVHLRTDLTACNHISLILRFDLLKIIVTSWDSTNIIVHRDTNVTKVMKCGWRRRSHASRHNGSFWLRQLPPAVGRKWSIVVLIGRREVIGWILISIDVLIGIVIDGGWWHGRIVCLHMDFWWL